MPDRFCKWQEERQDPDSETYSCRCYSIDCPYTLNDILKSDKFGQQGQLFIEEDIDFIPVDGLKARLTLNH